jgi:hypothetical protein
MSFANYLENYCLNQTFTNHTVYVAYGTAATESGFTEVVGNGYAREAYGAWTLTDVGDDDQEVSNDAAITFDQATGDQGTITHIAFFDALSGGNFLASVSFAELSLSDISAITGSIIQFDPGDCICTLD